MRAMLLNNPVLLRELRERVTGRRTMVMLTVWLLVLSGIVALYYSSQTGGFGNNGFGSPVTQIARVGQSLFEWVLFFMIGLVLFLVPGFTAASIAGERERQTLLPLQVTMLRPVDIIVGKVAASLAFTVLLLVATLPLLAFAFLIGGITISEVFAGLGMVVFSAFSLACLTVACSALVKRVQGAIVLAYGLVLLMVVGSFVAFGLAYAIDESRGWDVADPPNAILAINPLAAVADVSGDRPSFEFFGEFGPVNNNVDTPLGVVREVMAPGNFNAFPEPVGFDDFGNPIFPENGIGSDGMRFWILHVAVMSVLSVLALWVATRRVRTPAKTER